MGRVGRMLVVGILSIILVDVSKGGIVVTCVVGMLARLSSFIQVKESSSWNERKVVLGDWVVSLFV